MRALVLAALLAAFPASSYAKIGNELLSFCESDKVPSKSFCDGYVLGYAEGTFWVSHRAWCIPDRVNSRQLGRVFLKWATENPGHLHEPSMVLIDWALTDAFPCPR